MIFFFINMNIRLDYIYFTNPIISQLIDDILHQCSCGFNFPPSVCVHFPLVRKFCCAGLLGEIERSKIDDLV